MTTALTISENNTIALLPVQLQGIVVAKFKKPIKAYSDFDLATEIKNMIIVAHMEIGLKIEEKADAVSFMRDTLVRDFRQAKFEHLTLELIKIFISKGIRGEFPPIKNALNTINIQNTHYWIGQGLKSDEYTRGLTEFNRKLSEEELRLTTAPKKLSREFLIQSCKEAFEDYKKDGTLPFAPHGTYEVLKELLGVKTLIRQMDWEKVKKEAKHNLIQHTKSKAARKTDIPGIIKRLEYKTGTVYELEIKNLGLRYFFDSLISDNKNLEI